MRTKQRTTIVCLFGWIGLWACAPAKGDILDDIQNLSTAARDRATEARDRATQARDRATEARNSANELRDNARLGLAALSDQIRSLITESVEDMRQQIADELEGRETFVADGGCSLMVCEPFRDELIALLRAIEALVNEILSIVELDVLHFDFEREISIIGALPGRALFPLYRVLAIESNLLGSDTRRSDVVEKLTATVQDLLVLKEALEDRICGEDQPEGETPTLLESEVKKCACVLSNFDRIDSAKKGVSVTGVALKIISKRLSAKGETTATGANPGIHGYINVTIKDNKKKSWGETLDGLSEAMSKVAEFANDKLGDCLNLSTQLEMLRNQQEIKDLVKGMQSGGDFDRDGDTDLADFSLFQAGFGSR